MRAFVLLCVGLVAFLAAPSVRADSQTCSLDQVASLDVITSTDGWILVPIQVGPQKVDAAIDFGARYSILEEPIAHELQLKLVTFERYSRWVFGGYAKYKASVPLKIGSISLGETLFAVAQKPIGNDKRVNAVLGLDNLTRFDVELDLGHHKINLFAKNHCLGKVVYWTNNSPVSSLPLDFTSADWLNIPIQVNGRNVDAVISPVSESIYVNPHHSMENFGVEIHSPDLPHMDVDQQPVTPHGRSTAIVPVGIKSVSIDGITFLNPATRILDCDDVSWSIERTPCQSYPSLELGVSELEKLRGYLDFQDRLLYATTADAD